MLVPIGAGEFDFHDPGPGPVAHGEPGVTGDCDGIHAFHDDIESQRELIGGEPVPDDVPLIPGYQRAAAFATRDRVLDRVDAEEGGSHLVGDQSGDGGLACCRQTAYHNEHR